MGGLREAYGRAYGSAYGRLMGGLWEAYGRLLGGFWEAYGRLMGGCTPQLSPPHTPIRNRPKCLTLP